VIYDKDLLDRLSAYAPVGYLNTVYRATRAGLNPLTPSLAGGRWVPKDTTSVLYTSTAADGALSEVSFHLSLLNPRPTKPVMLHRIRATTRKTLRLLRADLIELGVEWHKYATLEYERCQMIGAAVAFLECDGLVVPSARWDCESLVIFSNNHGLDQELELEHSESVDWISWATQNGVLPPPIT